MKILYVFDRYEVGGILSFLDNLTTTLAVKGVSICLLGGREEGKLYPENEYFQNVNIIKYNFRLFSGKRLIKDLQVIVNPFFSFLKIWLKDKPDLIVFNNSGSAVGIMVCPLAWSIPKIYQYHGSWEIEEKNAVLISQLPNRWAKIKTTVRLNLYKFADVFCMVLVKKIMVLSEASKSFLITNGGNRFIGKMCIQTPGVPINSFVHNRVVGNNRLFCLARYDLKKGLGNLFLAVKEVNNSDVKLIIGGIIDSQKRKELSLVCMQMGIAKQVEIYGYLNKQEKYFRYQNIDLLILPSVGFEAYPTVIMEATSCGTPVIGTPVGGVPDMLSRIDRRLIVDDLTPKALAEKINWYIKLSGIEKTRLSNRCRKVACDMWNVDNRADEMIKRYRLVVQ